MKKNTIIGCVFDITVDFANNASAENILPIIYNVDDYKNIVKLPLSQMPEPIRKNDPNLRNQPLYEINSETNNDYIVTLGDNIIGIYLNPDVEYAGWEGSFFKKIEKLFNEIIESKKINKIFRMGLKYTNFIPEVDIFESGKVKIKSSIPDNLDKTMLASIEYKDDSITCINTITNNKILRYGDIGSIVEIIAAIEETTEDVNIEDFLKKANILHDKIKENLKGIFGDELAKQLGV